MLMEFFSLLGVSIFGALLLQGKKIAQVAHAQVVQRVQMHLLVMTTFANRAILVHLYNGDCTQNHCGMDRAVEVVRHPAVMLLVYHGSIKGSVNLVPMPLL